jgi:uncharacterized membrane protein
MIIRRKTFLADLTLYELAFFFYIYAFIGWVTEVIFHIITVKKFINRGFLYGPLCPVYGFGMVFAVVGVEFIFAAIVGNSTPIESLPFIPLVIVVTVIASAMEFFTGWILETLFHTRWWDYSHRKFNIKGYIALQFSLAWGVGGAVVLKYVQPAVENLVKNIPYETGELILAILLTVTALDIIMTVHTLIGYRIILLKMEGLVTKVREEDYAQLATSIPGRVRDEISERTEGLAIRENAGQALQSTHEQYQALKKELSKFRVSMAYPNLKLNQLGDRVNKFLDKVEFEERIVKKLPKFNIKK